MLTGTPRWAPPTHARDKPSTAPTAHHSQAWALGHAHNCKPIVTAPLCLDSGAWTAESGICLHGANTRPAHSDCATGLAAEIMYSRCTGRATQVQCTQVTVCGHKDTHTKKATRLSDFSCASAHSTSIYSYKLHSNQCPPIYTNLNKNRPAMIHAIQCTSLPRPVNSLMAAYEIKPNARPLAME